MWPPGRNQDPERRNNGRIGCDAEDLDLQPWPSQQRRDQG